MKNLLKLLIALVFFAGLGLAGLGLVQEDYQPTLQLGPRFLDVVLAAAFILGLGLAFVGGSLGRAEMERDLAQARSLGEAWGMHALIAGWMSKYPAVYYLVLSLVCVGALGGGAWGALTYLERHLGAQALGSVQCTVLSNRLVNKTSLMVDARLQCPVAGQAQGTVVQLRIQHPPAKWPQTMAVPVHRGRLGTVFLDGRAL
ncbi:hypothetical protein PMI14_00279 [Acidovorax sp. CF316]|uniref:hypothetical protein n=1 Tax=Acidovorax sp. CF316 TaxID=1144317 RepID=UPI00026BE9B2|nr:hypothetical protein [Acidovorax sp. CF316]EJE54787.1 hypothetical protein PMI14_00279 [Acidovorax sp. CF316]